MRLEFINRVKEKEVLGKSILTNDGGVLLRAGVQLSEQYISKLKTLGVLYVYIEDERLDDVMMEDERLVKLKQVAMKNMAKIIKNIHAANKAETRDSFRIVENLIEYIIDAGDVNKSLYDIQTYDNYTYVHCLDTGIMSAFLGVSMNFSECELKGLGISAILHDIGKTKISSKIINKKGSLTDKEFLEIKKHPIYGRKILENNIQIPTDILKAVEQHHERVDGSGYPYGLSGNQISKYGKVVSICDVYDAISNDRSYRNKFSPNEAYEMILAGSGKMFDVDMVQNFKDTFAIYPLGCCVRLSNSIEGYVIKQNKGFPDRPIIRVLYEIETRKGIPFYEIDLLKHSDVVIESVV
ncbi:HD-GYP domain-containing protein [Clostridium ganghwense]|uniref:HD-GYP domain-containing protein n=1 Tax=Clostridium ganghwense TaxID=312089 RepID=A0ABT4CPH8_9CLOT|nr:HD-GYP domain-containing protein [Clostridium ganghwense]MCY6370957.1 HD-GYP domain-containing protein [Clostridium ganghwense]